MSVVKWIYCTSHLNPHLLYEDGTCWCGVSQSELEHNGVYSCLLETTSNKVVDADEERRQKGLKLFSDVLKTRF